MARDLRCRFGSSTRPNCFRPVAPVGPAERHIGRSGRDDLGLRIPQLALPAVSSRLGPGQRFGLLADDSNPVSLPPSIASGAAANFLGPGCTCIVKSVLNLQHSDSFERDNPQTPKNAANADGFCLLVFLKMRLVQSEDAARPKRGLEVGDGELGAQ
jgi:hypothetical protein